MSTRAKVASVVASVGVLAVGWQVGTGGGQLATMSTGSAQAGTSGGQSAANSAQSGTFTGAASSSRFGSVTVTVTVVGGKVSDVTAKTSAADNRSAQINSRAVPVLRAEVLAAQSAGIATVSGATYTSEAYITSLQSALDKAGI